MAAHDPRLVSSPMRIGTAMYDITGPAAEVGMFGYAQPRQTTTGIHMRLRSRAFVFHDVIEDSYFTFVSVDTGCITEAVTQTVIRRLQTMAQEHPTSSSYHHDRPLFLPDTFQSNNVMLSATHTHCAPGGLSEFPIYSMHPPLKGFEKQVL
jgi:neutral ceramidase